MTKQVKCLLGIGLKDKETVLRDGTAFVSECTILFTFLFFCY